ncbi:hypothetical protein MF672_022795 [Actinomadura sp. ATCC 31491]|uniref:Uncharacterized protein n=1 Tax=Actinomadura luzonensis TaxID=2805427 RepID=A0ABT0FW85_9ACTN|nr:hypothetical protein [Actinomadura luzonensis]MCK2216606.1 hypothetical protein [Actinomadura luzonensis]
MSHNRSGLLAGLLMGLVAALVGAAALGAAVLFQTRLPAAVTTFGNGHPVSLVTSLIVALLVALAIGAARPRTFVLVPVAGLYAGAAMAAGQVLGSSVMIGAALRTPPAERHPADVSDITWDNFTAGLPYAPNLYRDPIAETWAAWLYLAVAALAALLLVTLRVLRARRAHRRLTAAAAEQADPSSEPGYRAPFEPAQPPSQQPTADLFTPRKPSRD